MSASTVSASAAVSRTVVALSSLAVFFSFRFLPKSSCCTSDALYHLMSAARSSNENRRRCTLSSISSSVTFFTNLRFTSCWKNLRNEKSKVNIMTHDTHGTHDTRHTRHTAHAQNTEKVPLASVVERAWDDGV